MNGSVFTVFCNQSVNVFSKYLNYRAGAILLRIVRYNTYRVNPDNIRVKLFLSNYVSRTVKDSLQRIDGVSDAHIFGATEYSIMEEEHLYGKAASIKIDVKLPEGATFQRTDEVTAKATQTLLEMDGVEYVLAVNGFSLLSGKAENAGFVIADLDPWEDRRSADLHIDSILLL